MTITHLTVIISIINNNENYANLLVDLCHKSIIDILYKARIMSHKYIKKMNGWKIEWRQNTQKQERKNNNIKNGACL